MAALTSCPRCGIPLAPAQLEEFSGMCPRCLARMAASAPDPVVEPEADPAPLRPGALFRDLEVVEFLDRGAMGFVYKARHKLLDREVALKVLAPTLASSPEFVRRFTREAKLLASLNDPH